MNQDQQKALIQTCLTHLGETQPALAWNIYPGTISLILASGQKRVLNRDNMQQLHEQAVLEREAERDAKSLETLTVAQLRSQAKERGITLPAKATKAEIIAAIQAEAD